MANTRIHQQSIAVVVACTMALAPVQSAVATQATQTPASKPAQAPPATAKAPQAPAPAVKPPAPAPPVDGGWPRAFTSGTKAQLTVYQPQVSTWENQKDMVAYSAVSYLAVGAAKPALGTVKLEAKTAVDVDTRLVKFTNLRIVESSFSTLGKDQVRDLTDTLSGGIPEDGKIIALDRVLASVDASTIRPRNVEGVKADPPMVFFSSTPAVMVSVDGDPIWSPIAGNDLKYAVNTNWDLFSHEPTKVFYLRNEKQWLQAADLKGPWVGAASLPESFSKLPADDNWKDVKTALPFKKTDAEKLPRVFYSTAPAEMILLKGPPSYTVVTGTKLMWVSNTDSDVFRMGNAGTVYYLVAGRWFSAPSFEGPWTFATTSLPEDFKKISLEHPRSRVLASVPGTAQAMEAVLLAQVPQTARVSKKEAKAPEVQYQGGKPEFQPIPQTTVSRATNTDKDIIKVGDLYYMCFQGVWFMGRAPEGPWEVASTVPKEIYSIPASSPSHNVTYVTVVEEDNDDDWVTFAAVAGYTGMMVAWGCAVWGTGYYYPPYVGYGGFYPAYYPYYRTYGASAWYNPWTGAYGRGASVYGPYGGAGVASRYNPRTGTYSRGAAAWGPYGGRAAGQAYNPRTGTYAQTRQGSNVYGSWGSTQVQRGNDWASTSRVTNNRGTTTRVTQGSGGGEAINRNRAGAGGNTTIGRTGSGDVYAGHDGNVYRKQSDGSWQQYQDGNWGSVDRPQPTAEQRQAAQDRAQNRGTSTSTATQQRSFGGDTQGQLNRDSAARSDGAARTSNYGAAQRSGSSTYKPSGGARSGGARAGGGRRR